MKDNIFQLIIPNGNSISVNKKTHKTAGLVGHKVYRTEAKITLASGPAVQHEFRALLTHIK